MKKCSKCLEVKSLNEFGNRSDKLDGKNIYCKKCKFETWDYNTLEKRKAKGLPLYQTRRNNREWLNNYKKSLSCVKCGEDRYYTLCFHHTNPSDKFEVVGMMPSRYGLERMKREVEKCVPLCSNCHLEFHHLERINPLITLEQYLK